MAKRIVTKIGDVFCAHIDNVYKRYFQYVCNDIPQMDSSVIRVFKTRYSVNDNPDLTQIVSDNIDFYAHTILRDGIEEGVWYKIGAIRQIETSMVDRVIWGSAHSVKSIDCRTTIYVNPMENWVIWKTNMRKLNIGVLPRNYYSEVQYGAVIPFVDIMARLKLGYFTYSSPVYDIIKRIPYPDVDSFTKIGVRDEYILQHFKGENVVQEIVISQDGNVILSEDNPLARPKFWETNWKHSEFITAEEFNSAWNNYNN